jgi:hypothetical protein
VGLLERIFDGEMVKPETLQNGQGCFRRFGCKVNPKKAPSISEQAGEFGGRNLGADRFAWAKKERADQSWPPKCGFLTIFKHKINYLEVNIENIELILDKVEKAPIILLET